MRKHYMTTDEMYQAWAYHKNGVMVMEIAKRLNVSCASLSDLFSEIGHILAGGNIRREKGRKNLRAAIVKIRTLGVELPKPDDFNQMLLPAVPFKEKIEFEIATIAGKKFFGVNRHQYTLVQDGDQDVYLFREKRNGQ